MASIIGGTFFMFFLLETKSLNLEEVAAVFGEVVVSTEKETKTKTKGNMDTIYGEDVQKTEV